MKIERKTLERIENYLYPERISTEIWRPMTLEQLIVFLSDMEFDKMETVKSTFGDELHLFIEDVWVYSVIRHKDVFFIKKVALPYEEWIAYITTMTVFPIFAPWAIVIRIWAYWVKKYGLKRFLAQQAVPIIAWWLSGFLPIVFIRPDLLSTNPIVAYAVPLILGIFMSLLLGSLISFILSLLFFLLALYMTWRLLVHKKKGKIRIKDVPKISIKTGGLE